MDSRLIFLHRTIGLHARDAVLDLVPRLDVGVPKGRGHFVPEADGERSEKSGWVTTLSPVLKLTQVDEENILRRSREPSLRN